MEKTQEFSLVYQKVIGVDQTESSPTPSNAIDANTRIKFMFNQLLERQFPINSPLTPFRIRTAADFAKGMAIHVNHLNRALKLTTGKCTSELISQRLAEESTKMLKNTNWTISEISYSLGFKSSASFNHFFKRESGLTPSDIRKAEITRLYHHQ